MSSFPPPPERTILQFLCICSSHVFNGHMGTVNCLCNVRKSSNPNRSFPLDAGAACLNRKMYWDVSLIKASDSSFGKSETHISEDQHLQRVWPGHTTVLLFMGYCATLEI